MTELGREIVNGQTETERTIYGRRKGQYMEDGKDKFTEEYDKITEGKD